MKSKHAVEANDEHGAVAGLGPTIAMPEAAFPCRRVRKAQLPNDAAVLHGAAFAKRGPTRTAPGSLCGALRACPRIARCRPPHDFTRPSPRSASPACSIAEFEYLIDPTMKRIWTPIEKTPPVNTAVELRFDDGSSDLAMWIGNRWLPEMRDRQPAQWRTLPVRLPVFDEFPLPQAPHHRVA